MKLTVGDTFTIETRIGYGFLQYIETDNMGIEENWKLENWK